MNESTALVLNTFYWLRSFWILVLVSFCVEFWLSDAALHDRVWAHRKDKTLQLEKKLVLEPLPKCRTTSSLTGVDALWKNLCILLLFNTEKCKL